MSHSDDPHTVLLEHVERLARELREVRDSTRRIEDRLDDRDALLERRRADADRQAVWRGRSNVTGNVTSNVTPPEVSLSPSRALSLSLPNPPEEEKITTSALSDFAAFVAKEWPDIKRPSEFETRATPAFPGVDLLSEAKKARGWECSDPKRRKRNHGKFLWGWLGRAQDGASRLLHPVTLVTDAPRPRQSPEQDAAKRAAHELYLKHKAEQEAAARELAGRRACKA